MLYKNKGEEVKTDRNLQDTTQIGERNFTWEEV